MLQYSKRKEILINIHRISWLLIRMILYVIMFTGTLCAYSAIQFSHYQFDSPAISSIETGAFRVLQLLPTMLATIIRLQTPMGKNINAKFHGIRFGSLFVFLLDAATINILVVLFVFNDEHSPLAAAAAVSLIGVVHELIDEAIYTVIDIARGAVKRSSLARPFTEIPGPSDANGPDNLELTWPLARQVAVEVAVSFVVVLLAAFIKVVILAVVVVTAMSFFDDQWSVGEVGYFLLAVVGLLTFLASVLATLVLAWVVQVCEELREHTVSLDAAVRAARTIWGLRL
ncbi:hypothetical protein J8273_1390 [Carpediemonas membranifera]|uniref:Uncharacterized protein n=1 Tax=Carpediemonas membranifera TaxID=201153 RepID=A0A8J6AY90_9EUKA|nr:hypothetical protein J8273_1390 [Carpediemonas membranifera]|eukprot:KAG9397033.1 hypothetical protein J8273_1390 [Carpediemonas membranifera]